MLPRRWITFLLALLPLIGSGCSSQEPLPSASPSPATTPTAQAEALPALHSLISQERVFAYLEDLTSVQSYSGWRNSATEGEAEALEYVAGTLSEFPHLQGLGLELERQSFHVFLATEYGRAAFS